MDQKEHVLVIGATGNIGGAVAKALLNKNHTVRTLSRNAGGAKAKDLVEQGIEVVQGDLNDVESLKNAMSGMDAVFAVTTPFEAGPEGEIKHGLALIDAAKLVGIGHFIYSSVGSANKGTGIPHFESKNKVEQFLIGSGLNYSISGPVFVLDNYIEPWYLADLQKGDLKMAMPSNRKLQIVSFKDVGDFGAALVERGEDVYGMRYDIASDEISGDETATIFSNASGRTISYEGFDPEYMRGQNSDMADMFVWFNEVGYSADPAMLRREFPDVEWQTAKEWSEEQDWKTLLGEAL